MSGSDVGGYGVCDPDRDPKIPRVGGFCFVVDFSLVRKPHLPRPPVLHHPNLY